MNDIVYKPIEPEVLFGFLLRHLPSHGIQLEGLKALGDEAFVMRMLNLFKENIRTDKNELWKAFEARDNKAIHELAHKMIPPCRHLGLEELVAILKKLENSSYMAEMDDYQRFDDLVQAALQAVRPELVSLEGSK